MTFCGLCQKVTGDFKENSYWSKIFDLIIIHCECCGHFKHQYLERGGEQSSGK